MTPRPQTAHASRYWSPSVAAAASDTAMPSALAAASTTNHCANSEMPNSSGTGGNANGCADVPAALVGTKNVASPDASTAHPGAPRPASDHGSARPFQTVSEKPS